MGNGADDDAGGGAKDIGVLGSVGRSAGGAGGLGGVGGASAGGVVEDAVEGTIEGDSRDVGVGGGDCGGPEGLALIIVSDSVGSGSSEVSA
jgi:hypothetical protein